MSACRGERVRSRLAALALAGLLLGQTIVPCGILLSSVHAKELRLKGKGEAAVANPRNAQIPLWAQGAQKQPQPQGNAYLTQLAQANKAGKKKGSVANEGECLDCEVSLEPLDLSEVPTEKALRRAGGIDGALYPMRRGDAQEFGIKLNLLLKRLKIEGGLKGELSPKDPRFVALTRAQKRYECARAINLLFGRAVKEWRGGNRGQAVELFEQYIEKYPQSPWSGESALHLGYAAKKEGRLLDAVTIFQKIRDKTSDEPNEKLRTAKRERRARGGEITDVEREADVAEAMEGAASFENAVDKLDSSKESNDDDESFEIHMKAKQQLADIDIAMGHFGDASQKLGEIMDEDTDWHRRVWARTQLERANSLAGSGDVLMACGPQALGTMMVGLHKNSAAKKVQEAIARDSSGFSMAELQTLAAENGVAMRGFHADTAQLSDLALPAILHYDFGRDSKNGGKASGHFVVLQGVDNEGKMVRLFDPLGKKVSRLSYAQLQRQWSGQGLAVTGQHIRPVGLTLNTRSMKAAVGSSTTFASAHDIGDTGNNSSLGIGDGIKAPEITANLASMNLHVEHTVTSYQPKRGPSAAITLSYNTDANGSFNFSGVEGVGRKWKFNYSTFAEINWQDYPVNTPGSQILVEMPDGSQSLYGWDATLNRYIGEKGNFNWIGRVDAYNLPGRGDQYSYKMTFADGTTWGYSGDFNGLVLWRVTDIRQQILQINYDPYSGGGAGKSIESITDADGKTTTFTTTTTGGSGYGYGYAIKTITDPFGRVTTLDYDTNANLIGVTDSHGRNFKYTYDTKFSDIKSVEVPKINTANPVWLINREGPDNYVPTSYPAPGANMGGNIRLTVTDPNNGNREYYRDAQSEVRFYVSPENYLPYPNTHISARLTQYRFRYNYDGERVPELVGFADGTSIGYDYEAQHGFVRRITDRQGKGTYFTYNSRGQVLTTKDPKGNITTTGYDAANSVDPISVTRPNPLVSDPAAPNAYIQVASATYNLAHQPISMTDVGGTTTADYTTWGAPEITTDPQGRATRNIYNNLDQLIQVQRSDKPIGNNARVWVTIQTLTYDALHRVKESFDAANLRTAFQYNSRDNVTFTNYPDGSFEQNIYRVGNDDVLVGVRDRVGRNSWTAYDELGRATTMQDASGQFSYLAYDKNSNLKQLTDKKSNLTQWTYDTLDRPTSKRYHDGVTESYAYGYGNYPQQNGKGKLVQTMGARGQIIKYEYDDNGNQTKIDYPNMSDVTMSYNRLDDVAIVTDGVGTHTSGYDAYGRLISNDGPFANDTQAYSYDELQRVQTQTAERGASGGVQSQTYGFDALGRLASLNANGTQGTGLTTYSYDGNTDRLRVLTHPNGTKSDLRYDALGRLQHVFNGANGDPFHNRYSSTYDARDVKINTQSRTGSANPLTTTFYNYDALDQLKQERVTGGVAGTPYTTDYNYDGMGNRTQVNRTAATGSSVTTSVPNTLNQLTSATTAVAGGATTTASLGYDVAGNTTYIVNGDGTRTYYYYDDADRLVRVEKYNAALALLTASDFVYDYASRRVASVEYDYANDGWANPKAIYRVFDGLDVVQERNPSNQITAQLVRDGNIGGILSRTTAQGPAFYGYDGNGNVTLLTDSAGQDVGHYRYDAFGNTLEAVGPRAGENPYRFSTKEFHAQSGLYDYGFRFYSPGMGRWINRDPLEEEGGINLYGMVGNDPINDVDEYGLAPKEEHPCMHDGIPNSCGPGEGKDPYVRVWQDDIADRGKDVATTGVIGSVVSAIPFLRGKGKSAPVRPPIRSSQVPKARAIIQAARVYKANGPIGAKATDILKGRLPRWALTKQERQIAARFYTKTARRVSVAKQPMAREYNLARAKYLLQGGRISDTLQKFRERGF